MEKTSITAFHQLYPKHAPMKRSYTMSKLQELGSSTRPETHAGHMLGYNSECFKCKPEDLPGAEFCNVQNSAVPLHNRATAQNYEYVVNALKNI